VVFVLSDSQLSRIATIYDRVFFISWSAILSVVLLIFGLEKFNISAERSIRERAIVNFTSPPFSDYGDGSTLVELAKRGMISDGGFPIFVLELRNPESFSRILVNGKLDRRVMHQGNIYRAFSDFFGSDVACGILKYSDANGDRQRLAVQFGYPDYDQSEFTLLFRFRLMVSDEIPASYSTPYMDPESLQRGAISDVRIEIPFVVSK